MLKDAKKQTQRVPVTARPQPNMDRKALRAEINRRFSESLDYLAQ